MREVVLAFGNQPLPLWVETDLPRYVSITWSKVITVSFPKPNEGTLQDSESFSYCRTNLVICFVRASLGRLFVSSVLFFSFFHPHRKACTLANHSSLSQSYLNGVCLSCAWFFLLGFKHSQEMNHVTFIVPRSGDISNKLTTTWGNWRELRSNFHKKFVVRWKKKSPHGIWR